MTSFGQQATPTLTMRVPHYSNAYDSIFRWWIGYFALQGQFFNEYTVGEGL